MGLPALKVSSFAAGTGVQDLSRSTFFIKRGLYPSVPVGATGFAGGSQLSPCRSPKSFRGIKIECSNS